MKNFKDYHRWKITIKQKKRNKERILCVKKSHELDPEVAWSNVFSEWRHRNQQFSVIGITNKGLLIKERSGETSEIIVNYARLDSVS